MPKILFRADADKKSGTGDLLSLIYLSQYFKDWQKTFFSKDTKVARDIFKKNNIKKVNYLPGDIKISKEVDILNDFIKEKHYQAIFLEIAAGRLTRYRNIKADFKACVNFDSYVPDNFNLVVNWDVQARSLYRRNNFPKTLFLLGPKYVFLKREILQETRTIRQEKKSSKKNKDILVFFGGFDRFDFTLRTIKVLERLRTDLNLNVIIGAGYNNKQGLASYLKNSKFSSYRIKQNINNIAKEYRKADFIITSGGLSLFEAIAFKTPVGVVASYPHQIERSIFFAKIKAASYLGFRTINISKVKKILEGVSFQSFKGKFLVDTIPEIINERLVNQT